MEGDNHHAIVFGATGIIGWAVVDQLLRSQLNTFAKVTAVSNRPVTLQESFWPESNSSGPKLQLVSGIDLRRDDGKTLAESLKQVVNDVESVSHIYYLVFTSIENEIEEVDVNSRMLQNVVDAHQLLCPNLQFVAFPGGTRGYGIYAAGGTFTPPLTEDMVNNLPPDYEKTVVYPVFRRILATASEGKSWTWCEVCPDAIIGFTPNGSQFSLALHWAQYLSLYAYNHDIGPYTQRKANQPVVKVSFPGNEAGASSRFSPVSAKTIGQFMIYASLNPDRCGGGQLFNIADHEAPSTYNEIWPRLAEWFGLVGVGPQERPQSDDSPLKAGQLPEDASPPGEYVAAHRDVFQRCGYGNAVSKGVGAGYRQLDSVGYWLTFDRQMSLKRLRETGFGGDRDPIEGWLESFQLFRDAKLIL